MCESYADLQLVNLAVFIVFEFLHVFLELLAFVLRRSLLLLCSCH